MLYFEKANRLANILIGASIVFFVIVFSVLFTEDAFMYQNLEEFINYNLLRTVCFILFLLSLIVAIGLKTLIAETKEYVKHMHRIYDK